MWSVPVIGCGVSVVIAIAVVGNVASLLIRRQVVNGSTILSKCNARKNQQQ